MTAATGVEFRAWPKIPRLFHNVIITEKIDGTNGAVGILEDGTVYAQSRNRIVTPDDDNAGFAAWVAANADTLRSDLGVGLHFGEWWGRGIQRGYGLTEKRFSLFNATRWEDAAFQTGALHVVPEIARGLLDTAIIRDILAELAAFGSYAARGFPQPEGICIYHVASRQVFKVTIDNDGLPKGALS